MHPYNAKLRRAQRFRYLAMAAGLIWALFMGWSEFFVPSHEAYFEQQRYSRKIDECRGERSSQRYDCRESLILSKLRGEFYDWTQRFVIVFAPPLLLIWLVTKLATPKRPPPGGLFRQKPDPQSRKKGNEEEP
ncbi:hypothetical protein MTBLM1_50074 [Rhodospirillaceae bacterium LM-1]|nr:hypothetical protein MTBLM1_50074 [Rhodospirillaceae bacterium LM-1]